MIESYCSFIYGHTITVDNLNIPFKEGAGPEINAVVEAGSYTFGQFAVAVQSALRAAGTQDYAVGENRTTQKLTIVAPSAFSLLISTGTTAGNSSFALMGFTGSDVLSVTTATSNVQSGSRYGAQFWMQSYVPSSQFQQSADATINKAASGRVEVIRFGTESFIEMNLKFITNKATDGRLIRNNPSGVEEMVSFLQYATQKKPLEFIEDDTDPENYEAVILESTPGFSNGTGYKLKEMIDQNLPDFFETGLITLRVGGI